jgi:adenylate kinase family enzyme
MVLYLFLFGPPGSGKTTMSRILAKEFGLTSVVTGDIMRALVKNPDNPLTPIVLGYMSEGRLVPDEIMRDIVIPRLKQDDCQTNGFVLDGYPLNQTECDDLAKGGISPNLILYFDCSDQIAIQRQCSRGQRVTDTADIAARRVELFRQIPSMKVLQETWFKDVPMRKIDANQDESSVREEVLDYVESFMLFE